MMPDSQHRALRERMGDHKETIPDVVVVVGVGGVGFWVATTLAMSDTQVVFHLIDMDVVSMNNLNRLPYPPEYAVEGRKKVNCTKEYIDSLKREHVVYTYDNTFEETADFLNGVLHNNPSTLFVDATDNVETQEEIKTFVRLHNQANGGRRWNYLRIGCQDGQFSVSMDYTEDFIIPENTAPNYEGLPITFSTIQAAVGFGTFLFFNSYRSDLRDGLTLSSLKIVEVFIEKSPSGSSGELERDFLNRQYNINGESLSGRDILTVLTFMNKIGYDINLSEFLDKMAGYDQSLQNKKNSIRFVEQPERDNEEEEL